MYSGALKIGLSHSKLIPNFVYNTLSKTVFFFGICHVYFTPQQLVPFFNMYNVERNTVFFEYTAASIVLLAEFKT